MSVVIWAQPAWDATWLRFVARYRLNTRNVLSSNKGVPEKVTILNTVFNTLASGACGYWPRAPLYSVYRILTTLAPTRLARRAKSIHLPFPLFPFEFRAPVLILCFP